MRVAVLLTGIWVTVAAADDKKGADLPDGQKAFQGTWTIVETEKGGGKAGEKVAAPTVVFDGDMYRIKAGEDLVEEGTFAADATKTPNRIRVTVTAGEDKGKKWHGIYELEGDTLRAVVGPAEKDPPTRLTKPEPGMRAFTLKRQKSDK
jgi:uncharacterized protein (TIGR03067 family)